MKSIGLTGLYILGLVWLSACGSEGSRLTPTAGYGELSPPSSEQGSLAGTNVPLQASASPTLTATSLPTLTRTPTPIPTGVITTTGVPRVPTAGITPTVGITSTNGLTRTAVITTTTILTKTWTYTDVQIIQSGFIHQITWNQDGSSIAAGTSIGLFVVNGETLTLGDSYLVGESVPAVAFNPGNGLLVTGSLNGDIHWWFPDTGKYAGTYEGGVLGVTQLVFSVQGETMVSGSDDSSLRVWDPLLISNPSVTEYQPLNTWYTADRVTSADVNRNLQIATAGTNREIGVWSLATGERLQTLRGVTGWVHDLAISPNGGSLAAVDSSEHLRLWDTSTWELTHDIPLEGFQTITALDFSPNGLMVALGGSSGKVVLWNLANNTLHDPQTLYMAPVTDIAFHPRERDLVSSYRDGLLRLWSYQP